MRKRGFLMLVLACFMGVAAVYLARGWLETRMKLASSNEKSVALTTVVIAKRTLSFGDHVKAEFLQETEWPASAIPADAFRTIAEAVGSGEKPRVVLRTVEPNEPVLKTKISGFGGKATLSSIIDPEMRAVAIRVNDVVGVAGFVLPGDRVDIMLTRNPMNQKDEKPTTDVLLQNVKVLAVDQEANETRQKPAVAKVVTVEVTPSQAQKLTLAAQVGHLSLALRKDTDTRAAIVRTVNLGDLRPNGEPEGATKPAADVAPPPRPRVTQVNIVRGMKAKTESVPVEEPPPLEKRLEAKRSDKTLPSN